MRQGASRFISSLCRKQICFHPHEMEICSENIGVGEGLERSCKLRWYETVLKISEDRIQLWGPERKKNIDLLERVHRRP